MQIAKKLLLFFLLLVLTVSGWAESHLSGRTGSSIKLFADGRIQEISAGFLHKIILGQKWVRRIKAVCFSPDNKNL